VKSSRTFVVVALGMHAAQAPERIQPLRNGPEVQTRCGAVYCLSKSRVAVGSGYSTLRTPEGSHSVEPR